MSQKKFAVILSGNGVYDGAEIHEAIMTLYAIQLHESTYQVFAPDIDQFHVINHLTGDAMNETRNVLVESARIARGNILPLSEYHPENFDILMIPGGFGAAKNLSTFAFDGPDCQVNPDVEKAVRATHQAGKPIGALCIAPVILAKVLGDVTLTVGQDEGTTQALVNMGAKTATTQQREITIDEKNKIVTSPCYMLDGNLVDIAEGAKNTVAALLAM